MTNKEIIERNIGLTFDFLRQSVKDLSLLDGIANHSVIEFVDKDFAKRETKKTVKPNSYLKVYSQFHTVAESKTHYGKRK